MVKQKEIKEIRKAKKMLDHQLKAKLKEKLLEILGDNDLDNGFTLVELSGGVLNKNYITENDKKEVYQIIVSIRKDTDNCLAFRNGRYGWAKTKEDVDTYRTTNITNGLKKVKSNINKLPKNYEALGITESPNLMINTKIKEFGVRLIGHNN